MKNMLTITSKGQTTLPSIIRKKLGIPSTGGVLNITFNEQRGEVVITKPMSIEELSNKVSKNIKPHTKSVLNADEYYQANRTFV